ncbi:MAG TPA: hypothetical protein VMW28_02140 [Pelolinea sp.]|nr:hypothetical protein [Pelolinea sp.]
MESDLSIFSPPVLFILFLTIGSLILAIGNRIAEKGDDIPAKHMHYSCGEDLEMPHLELNYHAFFRLALLFGVLHIVALVISTIPARTGIQIIPITYVLAAGVSILILLEREKYG